MTEPTTEGATLTEAMSEGRFSTADYAIFILMLVASLAIGVFSGVKNRNKMTTQEYLLGGRNMSPYPVALSLLGGWISAISILGKYFVCWKKSAG